MHNFDFKFPSSSVSSHINAYIIVIIHKSIATHLYSNKCLKETLNVRVVNENYNQIVQKLLTDIPQLYKDANKVCLNILYEYLVRYQYTMLGEEKYKALQKPVDTLENWCNIHMQLMIIKLLFETPHLEAKRQNYMTCNNKHNRRSNKKKNSTLLYQKQIKGGAVKDNPKFK